MAKIGDLFIQIGADIGDFQRATKKVTKDIDAFAKTMKQVGGDLTKNITLPILGFGAAALASSKQAQEAFKQFGDRTVSALGRIGDDLFEALNIQGIIDTAAEAVDSFATVIEALPDPIKKSASVVALLGAAIGPTIIAVGQLAFAVKGLTGVTVIFSKVLDFVQAHPLVAVASAIGVVVTAFTAFKIATGKSTDELRGYLNSVEKSKDAVNVAEDAIRRLEAAHRSLSSEIAQARKDLAAIGEEAAIDPSMGGVFEAVAKRVAALEARLKGLNLEQARHQLQTAASADAEEGFKSKLALSQKEFILTGDALKLVRDNMKSLVDLRSDLLPVLDVTSERFTEIQNQLEVLSDQEFLLATAEQEMAADILARADADRGFLVGLSQSLRITWEQFGQIVGGVLSGIAAGVGDAIAQIIVFGGKARDVFKALGKQILATIISTLIQIGIQQLILAFVRIGAASAETGGRMAGLAAETYGAAFASIAAIPIVGPALAPAAATAAVATMLAGAALAGLAGGVVGKGVVAGGAAIGRAAGGGIFTEPAFISIAEPGVGPEVVLNQRNIRDFFPDLDGGLQRIQVILDSDILVDRVVRGMPGFLRLHGVTT